MLCVLSNYTYSDFLDNKLDFGMSKWKSVVTVEVPLRPTKIKLVAREIGI